MKNISRAGLKYIKIDFEWRIATIKSLFKADKGYDITFTDGWSLWVAEHPTYIPKIGDAVQLFGKGIGHTIRGITINDVVFRYKTPLEAEKEFKKSIELADKEKKAKFKENKKNIDKRFKALPEVFQTRIMKFRNTNPDFRWQYEDYELFCCEEAIKIADHFKTPDAIYTWSKLPYEEQDKLYKADPNHSGNTFAFARRLAYLYLSNPDSVIKEHGALVLLVGCKEYGCPHDK